RSTRVPPSCAMATSPAAHTCCARAQPTRSSRCRAARASPWRASKPVAPSARWRSSSRAPAPPRSAPPRRCRDGSSRTRISAPAFLPRLPFFDHFNADEIDELVSRAAYLEVARGAGIFAAKTPPAAAFLVVRGAAEVLAMQGGRERRIAVSGPGQLFGFLGLL